MRTLRTFNLTVFLCVLKIRSIYAPEAEWSFCEAQEQTGICKRIASCPVALDALNKGNPHSLQLCDSVEAEEVVCCPDVQSPTKRKSEILCEKTLRDNNIRPALEFNSPNGGYAALGEFPYMAAIGFMDNNGTIDWRICSGALISPRFVLTVAHCYVCRTCGTLAKVRLGVVDIRNDTSAQDIDVKEVKVSENFNRVTHLDDIALIELVHDVKINENVYPACLHTEAEEPPELKIIGWGTTDPDHQSRSHILQYVAAETISTKRCNTTLFKFLKSTKKLITSSQICAVSKFDTCADDFGGVLQKNRKRGGYDIVGLTSYGWHRSCGTTIPNIYTKVSAYLDWIEEIVWPN